MKKWTDRKYTNRNVFNFVREHFETTFDIKWKVIYIIMKGKMKGNIYNNK